MGSGAGSVGCVFWGLIWLAILVFISFVLAGFCAGWYIILLPLTVCIGGLSWKLSPLVVVFAGAGWSAVRAVSELVPAPCAVCRGGWSAGQPQCVGTPGSETALPVGQTSSSSGSSSI
ncbi:hypothetical protein FJT64_003951 [Amphibalanus amphitrite]|uniref:Uncharacterized protein n=1 Tax=Amphibalanus amphitrite TaxID=1232801 RepID=A0A6A4W9E8_AMPAM|nr:hypothetical protein FJT64_003951 [Amphibalanus amphitrite]